MDENGGHEYDDLIHHTAYAVEGMLTRCRISTALAFNQRKPETAPALRKWGWVKTIRIRYVNTRILFRKRREKISENEASVKQRRTLRELNS